MNILYVHSGKGKMTGGGTYRDAVITEMGQSNNVGDTNIPNWQSMNWDLAHVPNLMDVNPTVLKQIHCPIIIDVHDYYWTRFYPFWSPDLPLRLIAQKIRKRKYLKILSSADAVITHCRYVFDRINHPRKFLLPIGYTPRDFKQPSAWENRDNTILFVGGNYFRKGFYVLLKALPLILKRVPNVKILVIGKERKHTLVAAKWMAYGLPVTFLGGLPHEKVLEFYSQARVYVLPSEIEASPFTLIEAMVAGTPIIASDVGGIPEMVTDRITGLLFPQGDYRMLADRIVTCLCDKQVVDRLIENGLEEAKSKTLEKMMITIKKIYQEVAYA